MLYVTNARKKKKSMLVFKHAIDLCALPSLSSNASKQLGIKLVVKQAL